MNTKAIKNGLTDDVLKELYESGKTSDEIAVMYGMTGNGVLYRLRKLGIRRMSSLERHQTRMIEKSGRDIYALSKDEFLALLKEKGERKIAKEYGCSRQVMKSLREKFGIDAIGKTDRINFKLSEWFTDEQEQVLYGSMLGDGNIHLGRNNGDTARYKECHCLKQKEYLEWKRSVLQEYILGDEVERDDGVWKDGRPTRGVRIKSHFHRNFRKVYDWFYDDDGVKHLPDNFEEKISPLSLAVWYMDDGSTHGNKPTIASCFKTEDICRICAVIERKFGIHGVPVKKEGDSVAVIHFDRDGFFKVVGDHIVSSMAYKVLLPERFDIECVNRPELKNYIGLRETEITDENVDDLADFWHLVGFPYPSVNDFDRGEIVRKIRGIRSMIDGNEISGGVSVGNDFLISCFKNYFLAHAKGNWSAKWHFDVNLSPLLRKMKERGVLLSDASLRRELEDLSGVHGFRPVVAKQIYDRYCPEGAIVLDPCGGWGGRMLGAYCSEKVRRYDCIDACSETVYGLKHLRMLMDRTVGGKEVNVQYGAYEDADFGDGLYDVVFTSPPYFTKEFYSNDECQSEYRYGDDYGKWLDGFLQSFVDRSFSHLREGGLFIVNIDNVKMAKKAYAIADDFFGIVCSHGGFEYVETLWMVHNDRFTGKKAGEPLFVFSKKEND